MIKKIFFILLCFLYFGCETESSKADRIKFMNSAGIHYHIDHRTNICFAATQDLTSRAYLDNMRRYDDFFVVVTCTEEVLNLVDNK